MKLWLLRPRVLEDTFDPWEPWYDKAFGFVVRAETEKDARQMAQERAGIEVDLREYEHVLPGLVLNSQFVLN